MNLEAALRLVKNYVKTTYEKCPLPSHGIDHVMRVLMNSEWIGKAVGLDDSSMKKLTIAVLLHDIAIAEMKSKEDHATSSAKIAKDILKDLLDEEDLKEIVEAIEDHSWSKERKPRSIIGAILQDADRLDALGAVGIFRAISYGVSTGKEFYDPSDPFSENRELNDDKYILDHFYSKLLNIAHYMNTYIAKKEAERRINFMILFLHELKKELLLGKTKAKRELC